MKRAVMLYVRGQQNYADQEPEVIELVTEGVLERTDDGWRLSYEESDLTGMQGVMTTFLVADNAITLKRSGKLNSEMVFKVGVPHDSLYQVDFGALMLSVCATEVESVITEEGGTIDVKYNIEIEQNAMGEIAYHLDIKAK